MFELNPYSDIDYNDQRIAHWFPVHFWEYWRQEGNQVVLDLGV